MSSTISEYHHEVKVTRIDLPGDDPKRVRRFRYMTGMPRSKGWPYKDSTPGILWPPYIPGSSTIRFFQP